MRIPAALEWTAIAVPSLVGIVAVVRGALTSGGSVEMADLGRLADSLSLCSAIAVACWCGTRLLAGAVPGKPAISSKIAHDRLVDRVLTVLVGFAGLLICEPLADVAERLFLGTFGHFVSTTSMKTALGWAGFTIQFAVVSVALSALVRGWLLLSRYVLRLER